MDFPMSQTVNFYDFTVYRTMGGGGDIIKRVILYIHINFFPKNENIEVLITRPVISDFAQTSYPLRFTNS